MAERTSRYKKDLGELARVLTAELIFNENVEGFEVARGDAFLRFCWYYQCPRKVRNMSVVTVYDSRIVGELGTYKFHSLCDTRAILEYMPVS